MNHHTIPPASPERQNELRRRKRKAARAALRKAAINLNGRTYDSLERTAELLKQLQRLGGYVSAVEREISRLMECDDERKTTD